MTYRSWEVVVSIQEIIERDTESFLDLLSELAVGNDLLMDITYKLQGVGKEPNTLVFVVRGDDQEAVGKAYVERVEDALRVAWDYADKERVPGIAHEEITGLLKGFPDRRT